MFGFLKKKIPAGTVGTGLLALVSVSKDDEQLLQSALPKGIELDSAIWETFCLRLFAADFAVAMALGDTSTKRAVLDQLYAGLRQRLSDEAFDLLKSRLTVYTLAVKTPHPNGIPYTVGKAFASLLTGADLPNVSVTMNGSAQFTGTFQAVTKTIKSFRIVP